MAGAAQVLGNGRISDQIIGMELTIVKRILAKHYGTISFVSTDSITITTVTWLRIADIIPLIWLGILQFV